jgi:hypothetical protein
MSCILVNENLRHVRSNNALILRRDVVLYELLNNVHNQ